MTYYVVEGVPYFSCSSSFKIPSVYYMIGDYWLQLYSEDLIQETVNEDGDIECSLKIRPINAPFNVLGTQAYVGYYIEHNFETSSLTFTPHPDSFKPSLERATKPT